VHVGPERDPHVAVAEALLKLPRGGPRGDGLGGVGVPVMPISA
jgi:hypothetical protein